MTFTSKQRNKYINDFENWILKGVGKEFLAVNTSSRTLSRYFDNYLDKPPRPKKLKVKRCVNIKIDAQYYGDCCVIVAKVGKEIVYWEYFIGETFQNYLIVLSKLKDLNYEVIGITSDWHGSIVSAARYILPEIPHQRCLVHTQRRCQSLLTRKPKTKAGIELKEIVKQINKITTEYEANIWFKWLGRWEERYNELIKERSYGKKEDGSRTWWYTHKNLRGAFRTLKSSQNHLFLYLSYEGLDKDTNGLESEFSHLKQKIGMHRGLKKTRKLAAISWYFYLLNQRRNH